MAEASANAENSTRPVLIPTKAAAAGFLDTARRASPKRVRYSSRWQEDGDRRRAGEHDEVVAADEERARLEREIRERGERIGAVGKDDGDDLL